ncbi:MAG: DUF4982 domain-containing protein [Clostridia bacterium]|nr:DUF4982 domain-containing protein [Clostridia bacterium]
MIKTNFNKGWKFALNNGEFENFELGGEIVDTIDLPFDFSIIQKREKNAPSSTAGGYFQCGTGKYLKNFIPKKGKRYIFMCDGSFGMTEVFINSNIACQNAYGYNSFWCDITKFLRYDKENEILIRVNNQAQPNARWYAGSGIYRDVYLCECNDSYIDPCGTFVKTKSVEKNTAYMSAETRIFSEKETEAVVDFEIYEGNKKNPCAKAKRYVILDRGTTDIFANFEIENAKIWDVDTPNVYTVKTTLTVDKKIDTDEAIFGVRTVNVDSKNGFILNGRSVKLRGGCIHHDQGALGVSVYPETEYRRIAKLKEAGFNSVRLSHNPQSRYLYEACDRLGMLVIDELFDYWTEGKNENDSHMFFFDHYLEWADIIVRRNRCHPSIVMWSTGNEISEKSGRGNGYQIARNIANKIRSLDSTRPLTHALCSLWSNSEEYEIEKAENDFPAEKMDYFAKKTAITADTVDIVGYNYLEYRLEKDLIRFPERVIINTETFPINAYKTIKQQLSNKRIAGDYVWTAWDYFGETGIGHVEYNEKRGDFLLFYPYHIANCGDIDIIGERKPQSYYREIAWELRRDPYIAVRHPNLTETPYFISGWGFYECDKTWCFDGYEGKEAEVYVFADCDEIELYINDKLVEKASKSNDGVYKFNVKYQPGKISAKAIKNGEVIGYHQILTEGKAEKINLVPEKSYIPRGAKKPDDEIIYVDVRIEDANGALCTQANNTVIFKAEGAEIMGVASGELTTEEMYNDKTHRAYKGKALLVLKRHKGEKITLKATADGLKSKEINL